MFPLLMTTVMTMVATAKRGQVMGNISIVISAAPVIGPTISGIILSALDCQFMFILVLPSAIATLVTGASVGTAITPLEIGLPLVRGVVALITLVFAPGWPPHGAPRPHRRSLLRPGRPDMAADRGLDHLPVRHSHDALRP